jgi:hypothetical protein
MSERDVSIEYIGVHFRHRGDDVVERRVAHVRVHLRSVTDA